MVGRRNDPGVRPVTEECITTGQGLGTKLVRALVELLFNDPEVTKIQTDRRRATCERSDATRKRGLRGKYRNHPRWSSRALWFKHARHSSEHAVLPNPSIEGTSGGWRLWPPLMSNVKHHEGSGDRRSIDSTIRGSWRHRAPSRTDVAGRTFVRLRSGWRPKPHSDIDLLVTVTVRLDETTRRALINDLWKLRLPRERDSPRCRSHHCCARRHHSVALSS